MIIPYLTPDQVEDAHFARESSYYILESGQKNGRPVRPKSGDTPVPGFGIRVHSRHKMYVLRHQGKPHALGEVGLISLGEARRRARRKRLEILEGPPPAEEMAKRKDLLDLFRKHREALHARVLAGDLRRRTFTGYMHLWERHLLEYPPFRQKTGGLTCITTEAVEDLKRDMAGTPVAFNRALQQLRAAFRLAVRLKWAPENPCEAVEPYGERPSTRMLSPEEIVAWANALDALDGEDRLSPPEVAALWALFYSGARPGEILRAKWEWVSVLETEAGKLLRIHLPQAKGDRKGSPGGRVVRVPPPASEAILTVRETLGASDYMIPGKIIPGGLQGAGKRSSRLRGIRRAFQQVCSRAGIREATPKVLRHVWRSVAPEAAVDKEHLRQLGGWASHRVPDSVYVHERDEALDAGAVRIAERLREVSGG